MIDSSIITSLIAAGSALTVGIITAICSYQGVKKSSDKHNGDILSEFRTHNAVMDEKIDNLAEKVNKHNSVIERTFKLEQIVAVQENKQSVADHRVTDLENELKEIKGERK